MIICKTVEAVTETLSRMFICSLQFSVQNGRKVLRRTYYLQQYHNSAVPSGRAV